MHEHNKLITYFIENHYSLGRSNVIAGILFIIIGVILAQFTYFVYNIYMIIGIIGLIAGIILCSTAKQNMLMKAL